MNYPAAENRSSRLGLFLFAIYTLCYLGFVLANAFAPQLCERIVFAGLNLAVVSGFGLIGLAFLLAMIYGFGCNWHSRDSISRSITEVPPKRRGGEA